MKDKNPEAVKLEKEIGILNDDIEDEPKNSKAYYAKAKALTKLKEITGIESYNEQALVCYNKAIELEQNNVLYLIGRSKLHTDMGNPELAVEDIAKIKELPASTDAITARYLNNTLRDIAKLDEVQSTIKKLQAEGKIDASLATALEEHAKVTANLVVQVGAHGERLDTHDLEISGLSSKTGELVQIVKALSEGRKVDSEQIASLMRDTGILKDKMEQNTIKIQGIEAELHKTSLGMKKAIEESKAKEADKAGMLAKIDAIEGQLLSFAKKQDASVSKIVVDMKKMMGENKFTKESLEDLQSQIDEIGSGSKPVTANMLTETVYANPLLNHPTLLKSILSKSSMDKVLNLGQGLDIDLVKEAAHSGDVELVLAGFDSLSCHDIAKSL